MSTCFADKNRKKNVEGRETLLDDKINLQLQLLK